MTASGETHIFPPAAGNGANPKPAAGSSEAGICRYFKAAEHMCGSVPDRQELPPGTVFPAWMPVNRIPEFILASRPGSESSVAVKRTLDSLQSIQSPPGADGVLRPPGTLCSRVAFCALPAERVFLTLSAAGGAPPAASAAGVPAATFPAAAAPAKSRSPINFPPAKILPAGISPTGRSCRNGFPPARRLFLQPAAYFPAIWLAGSVKTGQNRLDRFRRFGRMPPARPELSVYRSVTSSWSHG